VPGIDINDIKDLARRDPAGTYAKAGYGGALKRQGSNLAGICELHPDKDPSFTVFVDGGFRCFGCGAQGSVVDWYMAKAGVTDLRAAIEALGELLGIAPKGRSETGHKAYEIRDAGGELVATHHRIDYDDGSKTMWWERNGAKGLGGFGSRNLPLYGVEHLGAAETVVVCEGEKSRDALAELGLSAVGTVCGASTEPADEVLAPLVGLLVYLWPDNDHDGIEHMRAIGNRLAAQGTECRWVEWAEAPPKGDAADLVAQGMGWAVAGLLDAAGTAPPESPPETAEAADGGGRKPRGGRFNYDAFCAMLVSPEASVDMIWDAVPQLAPLGAAQLAQVKSKARERFGTALPARDFDKAVAEAQLKRRQRRTDSDEGRPCITCGRQLRTVVADALEALQDANTPPVVFVRAGELVRLVIDETGRPSIGRLNLDSLRHRMAEIANWIRNSKEGERDCSPPEDVVRTILVHGEWLFPPLEALVEHPVVRPGGEIADVPGYDPVTRLLYVTTGELTVPAIALEPTADDLQRAIETLMECLGEFPYVDGAGLANTLAMFLTPMVRPAIAGPVPLACITAPAAGTGKGLLTEIMAIVATGKAASMFQAPSNPEEWQKSILAHLVAGNSVICIDNVEGALRDPTLCMTLTGEYVEGRVLGRTETIVMPQRATWTATGNNLKVAGDMPRRCYWIRLDPQTDEPEARQFTIPNLKAYVMARRGEIIWALLTMVRAWYAAGCPEAPQDGATQIMGSFDGWQRVVGGILHVAGVPGLLSNQKEMRELIDTDMPMWRAFLEAWAACIKAPVTAKGLIGECRERPELMEVVPDWLIVKGEIDARRLGNGLSAREGRRFNSEGMRIQRTGTAQRRVKWQVTTDQANGELQGLPEDNSLVTHSAKDAPDGV